MMFMRSLRLYFTVCLSGVINNNNNNNNTGDARETSYLFQRISITLERFNSVLLHDTLPVDLPDL